MLCHKGQRGYRLTLSQLCVVTSLDSSREVATVQLANSTRVFTVPIAELLLVTRAAADDVVRARASAFRRGRRMSRLGVADAPTEGTPPLVPTAQRLVQIATDAADAMRNISDRVPCGVCCCSVQNVDATEVTVSEAPSPPWLTKLKATPAMNLHAELRAQYDLGADDAVDANVHPQWRDMLLYPPSLYSAGTDEWAISVCTSCCKSLNLSGEKPPMDSIANGNHRGFSSSVPELAAVKEQVGQHPLGCLLMPPSKSFLALTRLPC